MRANPPIDYTGLAWHNACRALPVEIRMRLQERGLWEDIRQEVRLAAYEAARQSLDRRSASNFVQRAIYRAARNMGYRKGRAWRGYQCENQTTEEEQKGW